MTWLGNLDHVGKGLICCNALVLWEGSKSTSSSSCNGCKDEDSIYINYVKMRFQNPQKLTSVCIDFKGLIEMNKVELYGSLPLSHQLKTGSINSLFSFWPDFINWNFFGGL